MSLLPIPEKRLCDTSKILCFTCIGRENCTQYDYDEDELLFTNILPNIRLYDKIQNKMIYSGISIVKTDGLYCNFENTIQDLNPIQMFGTKLLDKNNKEIFEGDIVSDGVFEYVIKYNLIEGFIKIQFEIIDGIIKTQDEYWSKLHNHKFLEIVGDIHIKK